MIFGKYEDKDKIQKGKNGSMFNTETMIPISEIRGDTVILKDGGLRAIIKVSGLNLDLKNYDEQMISVEQYKRFLNGLNFPLQILVRNTYLDLTDYIDYMKNQVKDIDHDVLRGEGQKYISFLDMINSEQGLIYTKEFYIIVPYYSLEADTAKMRRPWWKKFMDALDTQDSPERIVYRYREFVKNKKHLDTRVNIVIEGLRNMDIIGERLEVSEIISLYFKVYNPNSHKALG